MESIHHITGYHYFNVPDNDFEEFQKLFAEFEPNSNEDAVDIVKTSGYMTPEGTIFSREYTDDEIKSIFQEDCELSGRDKEMAKDKVADLSDRRKATDELKAFIKKGTPVSKKGAKTILKIMEAFEKYECEIN